MAKASSAAWRAALISNLAAHAWESLISPAARSFFAPAFTKHVIAALRVLKEPPWSLIPICRSEMMSRHPPSPLPLPTPLKWFIDPTDMSNAGWNALAWAFNSQKTRTAATAVSVKGSPSSLAMLIACSASFSVLFLSLSMKLILAIKTSPSHSPFLSAHDLKSDVASEAGANAWSGFPAFMCSSAIFMITRASSFGSPTCLNRSTSCWAVNTASSFDPIFM
mmetsp:Transcript_13086/g.35922  ORF Transcript_13086/g.35922 Transcript_13086/m.35922 type:complete len:222 (+) Transcript_13086:1039-1704(+)